MFMYWGGGFEYYFLFIPLFSGEMMMQFDGSHTHIFSNGWGETPTTNEVSARMGSK